MRKTVSTLLAVAMAATGPVAAHAARSVGGTFSGEAAMHDHVVGRVHVSALAPDAGQATA
jgi:hypothetical protein